MGPLDPKLRITVLDPYQTHVVDFSTFPRVEGQITPWNKSSMSGSLGHEIGPFNLQWKINIFQSMNLRSFKKIEFWVSSEGTKQNKLVSQDPNNDPFMSYFTDPFMVRQLENKTPPSRNVFVFSYFKIT